ncbi:Glycosyl hydrolase family 3 N terminal domain containing protein [Trichomonas vaginalis G3]|uniref:beta-glucosidase n=1 Tax=Trichomonas vaginalis (strain ATCC PRA-98 / G3) TaxID=412133 RepID=A2DDA1_TRIV3|nr:glycosyl hydrolase [Trichomonas vaginalis G3]EAY21580.1 Glycosyl hydrolase family 3 N terminal domain containing protein [Trichomonas vaginalis G3]KAI5489744.1 periplasmic beta-glucosidase-related family [Trichomonas vaginalis G3]|eukprot:XP_001582566.1 glycosyl hydrolase [Trichomonas vaginalis G3]
MTEIYKDPSQPIEARVDDLLSRMTVEEKVGQLVQIDGRENLLEVMEKQHVGSVLHLLGENTKPAIEFSRKTRLQIPVIMGIDAIHGHSFWPGATIFPTQLGISGSWDEDLIKKMAEITAYEMRYTGMSWSFSPVVCIARDTRWGRVGETFGEDPYLIGRFASAMVKGLQGDKLSNDPDHVMATAKHFAGYSETHGGRDASESDSSHRKLLSYFLPQFKKCVEAGAGAFMTGYQSMEGIPSTANSWLLRDILKNEWGHQGFLVTDWNNVGWLVEDQKICATYEEAAALAVHCGNDLMMTTPNFYQGCLDALKNGKLDISEVDKAVKRILRCKFTLGLFEDDRYPDVEKAKTRCNTPEHRNAALQAALEGLILLKNDGILPLQNDKVKVALLGPNADHAWAQLGDWSLGTGQANQPLVQPRELIVTVKDALEKKLGQNLTFEVGAAIEEGDPAYNLFQAKKNIENCDVIVVVVGDRLSLWGETKSTATLKLQGTQRELINFVADSGKPFIVDVISSKPMVLPKKAFRANAIIQQFSPGMLGGEAFKQIIFGEFEPRGRLTISVPVHVGQLPIYYNQVRGQHGNCYADMTQRPRFEFGYGLTYTTFEYVTAKLDKKVYKKTDKITATVTVKNTGKRKGTEIIQLYINDVVTSATWAVQELKGYAIVELAPGKKKDVQIVISAQDCSIVNTKCERVVEPGDFKAMIGMSSLDIKHTIDFKIE